MKRLMSIRGALGCAIAAFALVGSAHAAYTVKTIASGETFEIYGTGVYSPVYNASTCILDLQGGSTLQMSTNSLPHLFLWSSLICTNGPATLVIGKGENSVSIKNNFIVRSPGSLTIKTMDNKKAFYWGEQSAGSANFSQYDFSGLTDIVDADGNSVTPEGFQFSYPGTLLGLPPSKFNLTVAAGKSMAIVSKIFTGNTVEFGSNSGIQGNFYLLDEDAFTSEQTVKLASNRTLYLRPCDVPDFATEQSKIWKLRIPEKAYNFNVEGANNLTVINGSTTNELEFAGKVKGAVQIKTDSAGINVSGGRFNCTGDLTEWTGSASPNGSTTLCLNAASVSEAYLWSSALCFDQRQTAIAIGMAYGSSQLSSIVSAGAGQTITINTVSNRLGLAGNADVTTDTINIVGVAANGATVRDFGTAAVTFNGAATPIPSLKVPTNDESINCWILPDADGYVASPASWTEPTASAAWYVAYGDVTVGTLPRGYSVRRAEGDAGTTTYEASLDDVSIVGLTAGQSATIAPKIYDWRTKALLWLDPSQENTFVWVRKSDDDTSAIQTGIATNSQFTTTETCNAFRGLLDPRNTDGVGLRAWQYRSWQNYTTRGYETLAGVHPLRATLGAPADGLAYMAFDKTGGYQRRIHFTTWTNGMTGVTSGKAAKAAVPAKFAVFVFGSQNGGGSAIFGDAASSGDSYFKRTGNTLEHPMMKKTIDVWTNGVKVADSSTALFSGSWDIISMDTSTAPKGIGLLGGNNENDTGGHFLGEVIFFDEVLSDNDRRDVERYLAKKWGLASKYAGGEAIGQAEVSGSGDVSVAADAKAKLSGVFTGTLNLGAKSSVTLASGKQPYTESQVAALSPSLWLDPSEEGAITYLTGSNDWAKVDRFYQHGDTARTQIYGTPNGENRAPCTAAHSAFLGAERRWVDYAGTNETVKTHGNTIRLRQDGGATDLKISTKMGFIVQDSVRGGGTPFLDNILGNGVIKNRITSNPADPIYASGTTAYLTGGSVYLNGASANYANGFTGGPEVFTFTATSAVDLGYFAYLGNSENGRTDGEIQSEILLFGSQLEDTDRKGVEAYLMKKWFGFAPSGFTDYSGATLTGTGSFTAPTLAQAPKPAADFAGTLTVTGTSLSMAIVRDAKSVDTVQGAVNAPNATLAFPEDVAVSISCTKRPHPGTYTLITAKSLSGSFTLASPIADAELAQSATTLQLVVHPRGAILMLR